MDSPLKWHGGKSYLAKKIVALFPPHLTYVEPYAGGLSVLLAKDPTGAEVVNDIDSGLSNFWHVLANPACFKEFIRCVEAVPFSEVEWAASGDPNNARYRAIAMVDAAVKFFVHCRQSLAGRGKTFAPLSRTRTRRRMNEQVSAWLTAVEGLPEVHTRLMRVAVTCRPALKVIDDLDDPQTLFYLDPPYLPETRTSPEVYRFEMGVDEHKALLARLAGLKGRFLLSGYRSTWYDAAATDCGWTRTDFDLANHAASGATKRRMTECLWRNF